MHLKSAGPSVKRGTARWWMDATIWLPIVAVVVIGLLAFMTVQRALRESLSEQLAATVRADGESLGLWLDFEWARAGAAAAMLDGSGPQFSNEGMQQMAKRLAAPGVSLVDLAGQPLLRSFDGAEPELQLDWDRLRRGEPSFAGVSKGATGVPWAHIAVPWFVQNRLQGVLVVHRVAANSLSRVLAVGRVGESGESYAFDHNGRFISESRFPQALFAAGLLDKADGSVVLRLPVADPGANLAEGETPSQPSAAWPLTAMAARALSGGSGGSGVDVDGYRDYRGVRVIGAWQWLDRHGFGIAAEIDMAEAFRLKRTVSTAFIGLGATLGLGSVALALLQRRQRRQSFALSESSLALAAEIEQRGLSEARLQRLAEAMPYASLLIGPDQRIALCNPAGARLLGRPASELQQQPLSDFFAPDDLLVIARQGQAATPGQASARSELELLAPNGVRLAVEVGVSVLDDEAGRSLLLTLVDMQDRRQLARQQQQARQLAEQASQAKSHFLANMSHEIRTPLNAVLGYAQLLQLDGSLGADERRKVDAILRAGQHLLGLINSVLDMAKIEAGQVQLQLGELDLHELIDGLDEIFALRCEQQRLMWRCQVDLPKPCVVKADRLRLNQILINLIGNAQKFARSAVDLEVSQGSPGYRFVVRDDGPGLSSGEAERVFEVFQQGDVGVSKGGTGLGLAITRGLVEAMRGTIELKGTDPGCEARVLLPLENAEGPLAKPAVVQRALPRVAAGHAPLELPEDLRAALLTAAELGELTKARALVDDWARAGADPACVERLQARLQAFDWDGLIHDLQTVTP